MSEKEGTINTDLLVQKAFSLIYRPRFWQHLPKAVGQVVIEDLIPRPDDIGWVKCEAEKVGAFGEGRGAFDYGVSFGWDEGISPDKSLEKMTKELSLDLLGQSFKWRFYLHKESATEFLYKKVPKFFDALTRALRVDRDLAKAWLECLWHHVVTTDSVGVDATRAVRNGNFSEYNQLLQEPFKSLCANTDLISEYLQEKYAYLKDIEFLRGSMSPADSVARENDRFWRAWEENDLVWGFREKYFGYFRYYLRGKGRPFFFIYNPFERNFYYRGLLRKDISLAGWKAFRDECPEAFAEFNTVLQELPSSEITDKTVDPPSYSHIALVACNIPQDFRAGVNYWLYAGKEPIWLEDVGTDLKKVFSQGSQGSQSSQDIFLARLEAYRLINIYGGKPETPVNCAMFFQPLFSNSQYRGNFFITLPKGDKELALRCSLSSREVGAALGEEIEAFFFERFKKAATKHLDQISVGGDSKGDLVSAILKHLPNLLNVELAGCLPVNTGDHFKACCGNILNDVSLRECLAYGFSQAEPCRDNHWSCLSTTQNSKCRRMGHHGFCLLPKLKDRCNHLINISREEGAQIRFDSFQVPIEELKQDIESHLEREIELDQSFDNLKYSKEKRRKNIICWLVDASTEKQKNLYLLWAALDLSPDEFEEARRSISSKLSEVNHYALRFRERVTHVSKDLFYKRAMSQRHNIDNNIPVNYIRFIKEDFQEIEEYIESILDTINNDDLKSLCCDINDNLKIAYKRSVLTKIFNYEAFRSKGELHPCLKMLPPVNSPLKIVKFLQTLHTSETEFEIIEDRNYRDTVVDDKYFGHAFDLFYNLYVNAEKSANNFFGDATPSNGQNFQGISFCFGRKDTGTSYVTISNVGEFKDKECLAFLRHGGRHPNSSDFKKKGLEIIRDSLDQLGWTLEKVKTDQGYTIIELLFNGEGK